MDSFGDEVSSAIKLERSEISKFSDWLACALLLVLHLTSDL